VRSEENNEVYRKKQMKEVEQYLTVKKSNQNLLI